MIRPFPFESSRPVRASGFLVFFSRGSRAGVRIFLVLAFGLATGRLLADNAAPAVAPGLPDATVSVMRVFGALALVLGLFLGGAWLFKNWQRLSLPRGRAPRLDILETRSLGARQAVFVVGYDRQRFLVAASPAGVNLLSHLPDADAAEPETPAASAAPMSFGQALTQVLKRKWGRH
jgi:flagellar biogenesis protein FliO